MLPKIFFGRGCVKEYLLDCLKNYGNNIMLAYGGGSIKNNGIYDLVTTLLRRAGKNIIEFPAIMSNPTYKKVLAGAELAREYHVDMILGIGGGSVMDCCKAISISAVHEGDLWNDYFVNTGVISFDPLPVGVIVTVSGTGSEMNGGAVITNEDLKIKTGRDYPKCNPKFALMDPEYTFSVPKLQTASGGFDTLCHIMEIYFSEPNEDNVSDNISEALMKSVIQNLPKALENPHNYEARSNLMWASTMAENRLIKLGKRTDFQAHQIEHQIGAYTNCNHGCGLAAIIPAYYKHIYPYGLEKFRRFAVNIWNVNTAGKTADEVALEGIECLTDFIKKIGLPTTLTELNLTDEKIIADIAMSTNLSPGSFKKDDKTRYRRNSKSLLFIRKVLS